MPLQASPDTSTTLQRADVTPSPAWHILPISATSHTSHPAP